ncbi:FCD domain-containing protein [Gemmobacter fulvus]|uniref:FadR/GntR family transcriptional regulator n=1 Tax=Gemmobacter fulvus TaxID=2840474 RepID=UPI002796C1F1|nr:FCD domain-containing protein [Gemmobacter fulvus]MDQ1850676.1 FCD domain-containing protein [Gemmobacter fulvus]
MLLERETAEAATKNRTAAQLECLASYCADSRASADTCDTQLILKANYQFHRCIAEASRIWFIGPILDPLWVHIGPLVRQTTPGRAQIMRAVVFHDSIYQAIADQDAKRAAEAIVEDIIESNRPDKIDGSTT